MKAVRRQPATTSDAHGSPPHSKPKSNACESRNEDGESVAGLIELAKALATIDGRGSAAAVLDVIALPGQWDQYTRVDAAECVLMAGVVLPTTIALALADSILERTAKWIQDSDKYLLRRVPRALPLRRRSCSRNRQGA